MGALPGKRLRRRKVGITSRSFLVYRGLWPEIVRAVEDVRNGRQWDVRNVVLDIGCGEKPYQDLFGRSTYIGINAEAASAAPDAVGDALNLPIRSSTVDVVLCSQVIEHVTCPAMLLREAFRVLRSGGSLVLTGPFYWPLHEEPYDFFRYTRHGFRYLLEAEGFVVRTIRQDCQSLTQAMVAVIEALPRSLRVFIPLINVLTIVLQRFSGNDLSTLNYVCVAVRP